jgi:hypothetical protein
MQLPPENETAASSHIRERLGGIRGADTALRLLQSGLAASTAKGYGRLFDAFAAYCAAEGVSALPAAPATVICYVGHLAEEGRWAHSSMQPIFSAINDAHKSLELQPPACGSYFLARVRAGLGRVQSAASTTDSRTPLPAEAIVAIVIDGEAQPTAALKQLREAAAIAVTALFAGRQDSAVHLRSEDVQVTETELWLRLSEKGKRAQSIRRVVRLPLAQQAVHGHESLLPRVAALLNRYLQSRGAASPRTPEYAFQLAGETRPTTASMERWLAAALARCRITAPPGFAYLGHSIRSLGVSAMAAIGIPRHIYVWLGGWARGSAVVDRCYIDPTFQPSAAAFSLYGWALGQYAADAGSVVTATTLPDPQMRAAQPPAPTARDTPPREVVSRAVARRRI